MQAADEPPEVRLIGQLRACGKRVGIEKAGEFDLVPDDFRIWRPASLPAPQGEPQGL